MPANVDESIRDTAELEAAIAKSNLTDATSMTSSIFIMQIKRIASHIQEKIYRVDKQELPFDEKFRDLRRELDTWGKQILECKMVSPLSSTPTPRLYMSEEYYMLNYHGNMRLLFVPKLPMLGSDSQEFKLCLRSSGHICQIYKRLHQYLRTVSYSFIALQATYMAGITLIYCYTKDPSILDTQFLADIRACSTVLYIIAERWPASKHFRDSFETFLNSAIESGDFLSPDSKTPASVASPAASVTKDSGYASPAASAPSATPSHITSPSSTYTNTFFGSLSQTSVSNDVPTQTSAPMRFDMNLSSIIQVPASAATTAAASMTTTSELAFSSSTVGPPAAVTAQLSSPAASTNASSLSTTTATASATPIAPASSSSTHNTKSVRRSAVAAAVNKSLLDPVQGELWDILQQGAQQQAGADSAVQDNSTAGYTAQFDPLSLGLPINGLSGIGIGGLSMAYGGATSAAATGTEGSISGAQFQQLQQPFQYAESDSKQTGFYRHQRPHSQAFQQQMPHQHQQQPPQMQTQQQQQGVSLWAGITTTQPSAMASMSPNTSTSAMLSAMGMWPVLGNTVGSISGTPPLSLSGSTASAMGGRGPEKASALGTAAAQPLQQGSGGGAHLQDMNAEMGMGLGNAALLRWAGDIGDLYY